MSTTSSDNNIIITKLTALWALNESGLGGIMFALHIPLTGFFVGGFAVLLISLIAFYSRNDFAQIIKATVLVLIIKATASPHAPPPAYLAVAFQGVTGALLFYSMRNHKIAAVLLAVLAMAESSLQKIIVMTLIYGKSIWIAINAAIEGIAKDFSIHSTVFYSYWIIGIYVLIHVIWGLLLGIFAGRLPQLIDQHTGSVLERYHQLADTTDLVDNTSGKRRGKHFWIGFVLILLFVTGVFLMTGNHAAPKILHVILRSIAAVVLLFFVLRPIATWLIQLWLKKRSTSTKQEAADIMAMMPALKSYVKPAWHMAKSGSGKTGRLRYFILSMIILSLYGK